VVAVGETVKLVKAQLIELDAAFKAPLPSGKTVTVQFNPETLKVTFANRVQQPQSAGDQRGNAPRQVPAAGATKLALQLWFDVTAPGGEQAADVRALTSEVAYFMVPKTGDPGSSTDQPIPPGVRFLWGTFQFDGMLDSLEETLDFFSSDGKPLRSSLSLGLSGQMEIAKAGDGDGAAPQALAGPTPGTRTLARAPAGSTLQSMVEQLGGGRDWQTVAAANGVENPRLLEPGRLVDLNIRP
jgi:Contractile injection system tube protein